MKLNWLAQYKKPQLLIQPILISLLIFFLPSNLFSYCCENQAYIHGLLVDYLLPKIYVTDFIIIALLITLGWKKIFSYFSQLKYILFFAFPLIIYQLFTPNPIAAFSYLVKILVMFLLAMFVIKDLKFVKGKFIQYVVLATIIFQSLLGIYQFSTQQSLLPYQYFGEVKYSSRTLAKTSWFGEERKLPYGTTAHPNIYAGILVIYWLWLYREAEKKICMDINKYLIIITSLLAILALSLTQSYSAFLMLILGIIFSNIKIKKYNQKIYTYLFLLILFLTPLALFIANKFITANSIGRRTLLNETALKMFTDKPIFGIGINNYTAELENYSVSHEAIRFVQPVHHILLLIISETGLWGISLIALALSQIKPSMRIKLLASGFWLLPILTLDHYLLTQQSGLLLTFFILPLFILQQAHRSE